MKGICYFMVNMPENVIGFLLIKLNWSTYKGM